MIRLRSLRNKYSNKRCFVIGNGPSLNKTDLSRLKNEYTFGTNRIYLLFDELGFSTTFYIAIDALILKQYKSDINELSNTKFIMWKNRHEIVFKSNVIFFEQDLEVCFKSDPIKKLYTSGTVTYIAMQLAYYMGFNPVILVGVDNSYKTYRTTTEKVKKLKYKSGNHFAPNYFKKGHVWVPPDRQKQELGYRMAKYVYEKSGRKIIDATIGGNLNLFPKVEYDSLF